MAFKTWASALLFGAVAIVNLGGNAHASIADGTSFNLDSCSGVTPCGPFGSVTITGDGTSTVAFAFTVNNGAFINGTNGLATLDMTVGGTINTTTFSNTTTGTHTFHYAADNLNGNFADGLGSGFTQAFDCTDGLSPGGNPCGNTVTVTFHSNSGNLTVGTNSNGFLAGVDITCAATARTATGAADEVSSCPAAQQGATFVVGAKTAAVPLPLAGAGLPGLVVAGGALIALARRRRSARSA